MTTRTAASKTPDDQPFDFNLNAAKAEVESTPFRFLWATEDNPNRRWEMKHIQELDSWEIIEGAEGGDLTAMVACYQAALGKEEWKAFRAIPIPQYKLQALFAAYRKHCGQGESEASSDS